MYGTQPPANPEKTVKKKKKQPTEKNKKLEIKINKKNTPAKKNPKTQESHG
jgi:hypothetical protein